MDVLAVMDAIDIVLDIGTDKRMRDALREARATVAELILTSKNLAEAVASLEVKQSKRNANASFLDTRDVFWLKSLAEECNGSLARAKAVHS